MTSVNKKSKFIRLLVLAASIGFTIAVVYSYIFQHFDGIIRQGDFPAFYVIAKIVHEDKGLELYSDDTQRKYQNDIWPSDNGAFHLNGYPPYVGTLLSPLARLNPMPARVLFLILALAAFALSIVLLRQLNPSVGVNSFESFIFLLMFLPVFAAIFGGQTTPALLLALMISLTLVNAKFDFLAGLAMSLMLIKPQLGLPLLLLPLFSRRWKFVAGGLSGAVFLYLLGVYAMGWEWPFLWISAVRRYAALNYIPNRNNMVSLPQTVYSIWQLLTDNSDAPIWLFTSVGLFCVLLYLLLAIGFYRWDRSGPNGINPLTTNLAMAVPVIIVASPQALFYELTLPIFCAALFLNKGIHKLLPKIMIFLVAVNAAVVWRYKLPLPTFIIFGVILLIFVVRQIVNRRLQPASAI